MRVERAYLETPSGVPCVVAAGRVERLKGCAAVTEVFWARLQELMARDQGVTVAGAKQAHRAAQRWVWDQWHERMVARRRR